MTSRPDTMKVLEQLKNFQRDTVEHVFRRMYLDADCTRRFLIADEVGLGKTLVARGVIAKTIDHLWDRSRRIDIVYVCSNAAIARQNIESLNVTGGKDFVLASRITLLPLTLRQDEEHGLNKERGINFVSFTPGTSFDLKDSSGISQERALLYWLLAEAWDLSFNKASRVLEGYTKTEYFREQLRRFDREKIHSGIQQQFVGALADKYPDMRERFHSLADAMPKSGATIDDALKQDRNAFVGALRRVLAETCLHWLTPDLVILDEFQRFKHLLDGDGEAATEAAQLAHHLFSYQENAADSATAARVMLLSATPYKMYTLRHEKQQDDHHADFQQTLKFLQAGDGEAKRFQDAVAAYREALFGIINQGEGPLSDAKRELEQMLHRVMVRTERLAVSADRNGLLRDAPCSGIQLTAGDVDQYLGMQRVAAALEHDDLLEYWKSAPYLLNFMEEYDLKRQLAQAVKAGTGGKELVRSIRGLSANLLSRRGIDRYKDIEPANPRMRWLQKDTVDKGAWKLLWIAPSMPYYQGVAPYDDPALLHFTKRLIFSCWKVAPKSIAALLSYEAERRMMQQFRKKARNTREARERRRPLLRFTFSKGRPTGMPVLGLLYPSQVLSECIDPLNLLSASRGVPPTLDDVLRAAQEQIRPILQQLLDRTTGTAGPVDESWYWAAPILLDKAADEGATKAWFAQSGLAKQWAGAVRLIDEKAAKGWSKHVQEARDVLSGKKALGPPPPLEDLLSVLARKAVAGPGIVSLRALRRVLGTAAQGQMLLKNAAAPLAHCFVHLFNLPEVTALVRRRDTPYWKSVLDYCAAGNLQATIDEYIHGLVTSPKYTDKVPEAVCAGLINDFQQCLTMRTSTAQADIISAEKRSVRFDEPVRMRTRFAMRFGDQKTDDGDEVTRPDQVRAAFNSPFWPFVLATTSVGQEGLDFHPYCHAVVHWNIPSNPVDLEQREGRVHRYKNHAVRKNVAERFGREFKLNGERDPWESLFRTARGTVSAETSELFPFWTAEGSAMIERYVPVLQHSQDARRFVLLRRALVIYRMVFGQNRQEDLIEYLLKHLPEKDVVRLAMVGRIDLAPPSGQFSASECGTHRVTAGALPSSP